MKWIFVVLVLILCLWLFYLSSFIKDVESQPIERDWVCWVSSTSETYKECGTYGYSKSKKAALKAAMDKCEEYCKTKCALDYCEVLKK